MCVDILGHEHVEHICLSRAGAVHCDVGEIIKEDIIHELLCLSVKIPFRFLLQLVPWPGF